MRSCFALLAFVLFWGISGYAQPDHVSGIRATSKMSVPSGSGRKIPPITLHLRNTTLQKILDTLAKKAPVIFSSLTDPHKYRHIDIRVKAQPLEVVLTQILQRLSLGFHDSWYKDTLFVDIFPLRTSAAVKPDSPHVSRITSRSGAYDTLPPYTLSTSFNNGYEQVKIASTTGSYSTETKADIDRVVDRDLFAHLDGQLSGLTMGSVR
ncbi:MAG TPA: hypothetical protein VG605_01980, partial [Puia sp.]|nr:hypothetical protein [Puia sp.]